MRFVIRVVSAAGPVMWLREGPDPGTGPVARFRTRQAARKVFQAIVPGLEEGDIAQVLPAPCAGPATDEPFTASELLAALEESVKLQSHYASLLNTHDGGHRIGFDSARSWIERLRETRLTDVCELPEAVR